MSDYVFKVPDVGEGVAEAELVSWFVEVGDQVEADQRLAEVLTDKVSLELPSPISGVVVSLHGSPGERLAVGAELVILRPNGESAPPPELESIAPPPAAAEEPSVEPAPVDPTDLEQAGSMVPPTRPTATPPVRRRAKEAGIDLSSIQGTGPQGRVTHGDLDRVLGDVEVSPSSTVTEVPVVGIRRAIADQMSRSKSRIPHITYVEEIDVTALQTLRETLNRDERKTRISILPFVMIAIARAISEHPRVNARFDDDRGVIEQDSAVHIGIATQTPSGLLVPVVRNVETLDLWACAAELARVSEAAKKGKSSPADLKGSTITISSLGSLGGIVSTPVINHPEVAIVGINKVQIRPAWDGVTFSPRKMMNLSSAFDHRVIDGWDAATFVQTVRGFLEEPATMFIDKRG